jgi:uroporphyrin-III C-methyltransferase
MNATGGFVALVGAGPGDPELVTLKAVRHLRRADVVLTDALANPALLEHCRADAEIIDVGKAPRGEQTPQEVTNRLLVEEALAGRYVVRLKGGDPFVFGRGGEEAIELARAGVSFEVVPGISSALAAPLAAGIPVTHRGVSSQVTIVTGSAARSDAELAGRWHHLAQAGGTLVFLMPVHNLERIAATLVGAGLSPCTPSAIVENATRADQRVIDGTLAQVLARARAEGVGSPAVLVIGDTAALRDVTLPPSSPTRAPAPAPEPPHVHL